MIFILCYLSWSVVSSSDDDFDADDEHDDDADDEHDDNDGDDDDDVYYTYV